MFSLLELFPGPDLLTIVDIGAALNDKPVYQGLIDAGRARLIGFEPDPAECRTLEQSYGPPHRFFPCFIGDGRPATFHETNWSLTGSLYEPNTPLLEKFNNLAEVMTPVATHGVETRRLADVAEIDDVDFIKMDVQGAELAVLENAGRLLDTCLLIQTEVEFVPMYKDQPMFADVDRYLRSQGFQFHTFQGAGSRAFKPLLKDNNPNLGLRQLLWADAVYVRDWMLLDRLAANKLARLAILLHDVMQSYDLCHVVLEELDRRSAGRQAKDYMQRLQAA
jgi:FkbM family methyltransferase